MMRKRKAEPISAELVVSTGTVRVPAEIVPSNAEEFQMAIARLVEQKVNEALNGQHSVFQPWFQPKAVYEEIQKKQTIAESQKFVRYYEMWGCLICETQKQTHRGLGMCQKCYMRTDGRLRSIVRRYSEREAGFIDTVRLAREAIAGTPKALPAKTPKRKP
jgi:hypothetical protein